MRKCLFLLLFFPMVLFPQEQITEELPDNGIFPLTMVLESVLYPEEGFWRPDWPLELAFDVFKVRKGEISGCRAEGEGFSLAFTLGQDKRVLEYPVLLNGRMAQAVLAYRGFFEIEEMQLVFASGEEPWKLEFLENRNSFPYFVRAVCGETWYFIYFSRGIGGILETWYNEEGTAIGVYSFSLIETQKGPKIASINDFSRPDGYSVLHYDSRGLLTGILGPDSFCGVQYFREDLPRNWQNETGDYYLQWDEDNLLVRILGEQVDYRYEYTLDNMGNWIERRETRMIRDFGVLIPTHGSILKRVLDYRNPAGEKE